MNDLRRVQSVEAAQELSLARLIADDQPVVMRGAVKDWPLVAAGREGAASAMAYLERYDSGQPIVGYTGPPEIGGRFFYNDDISALNYQAERIGLKAYLARMAGHLGAPGAPSFYIGSTDLDHFFPGLRQANAIGVADAAFGPTLLASIWIGTQTVAATHFDMSYNLAACAVGRRRFTLFPPEQIANLYPGPLEPTPGGQVVSMVDLRAPDLARYPRFAQALEQAQVAELEPGDVLFYPALWWHNVEALAPFNAMINYWWTPASSFMDTPMNTLLHGLLPLRDRSEPEKRGWRALFDYYVFGPPERPAEHLPIHTRGDLAPLDDQRARRLRARLLNRLNR